ncbi:hypothetical protein [Acinetobacter sp. BSP-28]|uniref:hypothetical protein n=1 Tax=Acinetobacter sp. BSP-28 TaxID=3344661 RepID=UPI0037702AC0
MNKNTKTERPILFNSEMVKAILSGNKTQTRRIMRRQPDAVEYFKRGEVTADTDAKHAILRCYDNPKGFKNCASGWSADATYKTPFSEFNVGDQLWVRETFMDLSGTGVEHRDLNGKLQRYAYGANCPRGSHSDELRKDFGLKWKPSIHMPRSASRLVLEITNIRVERLNDISEADAIAEGLKPVSVPDYVPVDDGYTRANRTIWKGYQNNERAYRDTAKDSFMSLWQSVYGADSWVANPWVWVIEFKVIEGASQ